MVLNLMSIIRHDRVSRLVLTDHEGTCVVKEVMARSGVHECARKIQYDVRGRTTRDVASHLFSASEDRELPDNILFSTADRGRPLTMFWSGETNTLNIQA